MTDPRPIAEACTVDQMLAAYRARMAQLQVTHGEVDRVSTLADGYTSKLLAANPAKNLGPFSFQALNTTLGVKWVMVEDAATLKHTNGLNKASSANMLAIGAQDVFTIKLTRRRLRKMAKAGAKARNEKLSPRKRSQLARRAATIRWNDVKAAVAKT